MEPAGALGIAGIKKWLKLAEQAGQPQTGKHFATVLTGANMNFDRLRHVSERAEIGEGRETVIAVVIPEKPGSFQRLFESIGDMNITEFNYRYSGPEIRQAFLSDFERSDPALVETCMAELAKKARLPAH